MSSPLVHIASLTFEMVRNLVEEPRCPASNVVILALVWVPLVLTGVLEWFPVRRRRTPTLEKERDAGLTVDLFSPFAAGALISCELSLKNSFSCLQ